MGQTIDVETFKKNIINAVDGKDSLFETYIKNTSLTDIFKDWFNKNTKLSTENSKLKMEIEQLEVINSAMWEDVETKVREKSERLYNDHEELKKEHEKLLGNINFVRDLFGRQ